MRRAVFAAVLLAGCQQEPVDLKVEKGRDVGGLRVGSQPKSGTGAPQQETSTEIPIALQGRWAVVVADCTRDTGNPDGLLVVGTSSLDLHQAEGRLRLARFRSPTVLEADFAFDGRERSWTSTETLSLEQDVLYRKNGALQIPLRYERCA